MTDQTLAGRKVAVLATDGFEQSELEKPVEALKAAGAIVEVVSPKSGQIQGWEHHDKGRAVPVDRDLSTARPEDYQAIMLPGGVINPDALRLEPQAIDFIRHFVTEKKPIAAICHGPWTLINAGARPISRTPAPAGSIARLWSTTVWSPRASPMTCRRSAPR